MQFKDNLADIRVLNTFRKTQNSKKSAIITALRSTSHKTVKEWRRTLNNLLLALQSNWSKMNES